jgi:hypothetical protein
MMLRLLAALLLLYGEVRAETPAEKAGFAPAARVSKYEVWSDVVALDAALHRARPILPSGLRPRLPIYSGDFPQLPQVR